VLESGKPKAKVNIRKAKEMIFCLAFYLFSSRPGAAGLQSAAPTFGFIANAAKS
jgi:hypothetical protein